MMKKLLQQLMLYLRLGVVEGGDDDPPADDDPPGDDPPADDPPADDDSGDDLDSLIDAPEVGDKPAPKVSRANETIRRERKRAQEADEARIRAEERAAILERNALQNQQGPSHSQRLYQEEEAKLRDSATTPLEKWQIESNRTIRLSNERAERALMSATDIADKTSFDRMQTLKPQAYDRYADRVEKLRADSVAKGNPIDRMVLFKLLIGDDVVSGKAQSSSAARKKAPADSKEGSRIDRGKSPGARSDVSGRGSKSDAEKRRERLRGVGI